MKRQSKAELGQRLERIVDDIKKTVLDLVTQYRDPAIDARLNESIIHQAIDTPRRVRAMFQAWIAEHDAENGAGAGVALMNDCLLAAGSVETVATLSVRVNNLVGQGQAMIDAVQAGTLTYDQAADEIETALTELAPKSYFFERLRVPDDYVDGWGDPWYR